MRPPPLSLCGEGAIKGTEERAFPEAAGACTWPQVTWTAGVTQGGSSGSPLIDTVTHRVVGVLTGGLSSCQTAQSPDYYGRLAQVPVLAPLLCY
jgi:hypothetical protein